MSGHSKWATIKHKKGALDAKRGKIFTRLIKEIAIAAKNGGDPDMNPRLRTAIAAAKAENMPADNIKRAIQRGTGELPGATYEEFTLEGYGPGGVAILAEINTDNRNRTVSEIRHVFGKNNGNMAEAGAVSWLFHKKGDIVIPKSAAKEDDLMSIVLDAGADDLRDDGDNWEVLTNPSVYETVLEAVKKARNQWGRRSVVDLIVFTCRQQRSERRRPQLGLHRGAEAAAVVAETTCGDGKGRVLDP